MTPDLFSSANNDERIALTEQLLKQLDDLFRKTNWNNFAKTLNRSLIFTITCIT